MILGVMLMAVMVFTRSTQNAYESVSQDTELTFNTRRAVERIADDLRRSDADHVTVDHTNPDYDSVELQVPLLMKAGTVEWGAEREVGWKIQYLVEDGNLIRRVVDASGVRMRMDEVLAVRVDSLWDGKKGFSITENGDLLTLTVRVVSRDSGRRWWRQITTAVSLRN